MLLVVPMYQQKFERQTASCTKQNDQIHSGSQTHVCIDLKELKKAIFLNLLASIRVTNLWIPLGGTCVWVPLGGTYL